MSRTGLTRLLSDYGMLIVLILLCVFYSFSTMTEQNPRGSDAAELVASMLLNGYGTDDGVLIVSKSNPEHQLFANTLKAQLESEGFTRVSHVEGEPPAVRSAFEQFDSTGTQFAAIASRRITIRS